MALPTPGVTTNWGGMLNTHLTSGQDADIAAYVNDPASQVRAGLSATYGRTYRPEAYGAVGDGVADDLAAFEAMADAIAADVSTPARIEITGVHYLSDGVNIDAENVECYLAEGSHVFTTAATTPTNGHTLGFIGYVGSGAVTTPRRASVAIYGSGKVTGWNGGGTAANNENAIGIVRYAKVIVDGPQGLEAGNKALTTQLGVDEVTIRNLGVTRANFRGVSVEDGTTKVTVDDVDVESSGAGGVVCSSEGSVKLRKVRVGESNTNGGTTEAAVRATGIAPASVTVDDIQVDDAGTGKGVIVANVTSLAMVDHVAVGASGGSAVELQSCTGTNYVGLVDAPASPAAVVATGTTPVAGVKRTGQPAPDAVLIAATRFSPVIGSPVVGFAGAQLPGYLVDMTTTEAVAVMLGRDTIPATWKTFAVDLLWTNTTTNAGDVRFDASHAWLDDGDAFSTGTYASGTPQSAPIVFGTLKQTRVISTVTPNATKNLYLRVLRNAGDAGDTLPNDAGIVAVKLIRLG